MELNDPQRRHFAVILQSLENTLLEIIALAGDDAPDTRHLTHLAHDLPPGYLARVRPAIDAITEQMERLSRAIGLDPHPESKARAIGAMLTAQLNQLQDSSARTLKRYGKVDPGLAGELDPVLASIEERLGELKAELKRKN
jgi:hypothetical protein